jgi:hypothetical protein
MSISMTVTLEVEMGEPTNALDVIDVINVDVFIFQNNLWVEVVKVIKPFLQFLKVYDSHCVHNMFTIMFEFPCFKFLWVMENYVGHANCIFLTFKYDENVIIFLLVMVFKIMNIIVQACVLPNLN